MVGEARDIKDNPGIRCNETANVIGAPKADLRGANAGGEIISVREFYWFIRRVLTEIEAEWYMFFAHRDAFTVWGGNGEDDDFAFTLEGFAIHRIADW